QDPGRTGGRTMGKHVAVKSEQTVTREIEAEDVANISRDMWRDGQRMPTPSTYGVKVVTWSEREKGCEVGAYVCALTNARHAVRTNPAGMVYCFATFTPTGEPRTARGNFITGVSMLRYLPRTNVDAV